MSASIIYLRDRDVITRDFRMGDLQKVDSDSSLIGKEDMINGYHSIFTFEYHGEPIACAGLVKLWVGVAEAWTVLGKFTKHHPLWFINRLKKELAEKIEEQQLHRVQMHVEDTPQLRRWAEILGFHHEGSLERYTADCKTLHVYALLPHGQIGYINGRLRNI